MQTPPWQHGMIQSQKVLIKNQVSFFYSHIYIIHNPGQKLLFKGVMGVLLPFGQKRPVLENLQILNR